MAVVLVINDDQDMLSLYDAVIRDMGHRPVTKVEVGSAVEVVREVGADALIVDLQSPTDAEAGIRHHSRGADETPEISPPAGHSLHRRGPGRDAVLRRRRLRDVPVDRETVRGDGPPGRPCTPSSPRARGRATNRVDKPVPDGRQLRGRSHPVCTVPPACAPGERAHVATRDSWPPFGHLDDTHRRLVAMTNTARRMIVLGVGAMVALSACNGAGSSASSSASGGGGGSATGTVAFLLPEKQTARYEAADHPLFEAKFKELCPNTGSIYSNAGGDDATQLQQAESADHQGRQGHGPRPERRRRGRQDRDRGRRPGHQGHQLRPPHQGQLEARLLRRVRQHPRSASCRARPCSTSSPPTARPTRRSSGSTARRRTTTPPCSSRARTARSTARSPSSRKTRWRTGRPMRPRPSWRPRSRSSASDGFDGVYVANDGGAGGAIAAMKANGVDPKTKPTTGQDAELAGIQRIIAGEQFMTVYKPIKKPRRGVGGSGAATCSAASRHRARRSTRTRTTEPPTSRPRRSMSCSVTLDGSTSWDEVDHRLGHRRRLLHGSPDLHDGLRVRLHLGGHQVAHRDAAGDGEDGFGRLVAPSLVRGHHG